MMNAYMCTHIFDVNNSKHAKFKLYDMCATSSEHCSKAVTLFNTTDEVHTKDSINWDNVITFGLGNTIQT